ncbi:MAG: tRNA(Ile)-lysidine synthetase, partial [Proteobacteria bacterium]|nr:tRNA(Ile)-lysidine synthetase [Pseudomonadota bacterium]
MSNLSEKVKKTLKKFSMLKENSKVLLCVSGGVDSVVLLDLFVSLAEELKIELA